MTPWTAAIRLLSPWNSPGKNTGVGCFFLLQGTFLTQGLNPYFLHSWQTLYQRSHQGSPAGKTSLDVTKERYKPAKCVHMHIWLQIVLCRSHKLVFYRNYKHAFIGLHTVYTLDNFCHIAIIYSHFTYFHNLVSHYNLGTWASWSKVYKINLETLL